MYRVLFFLSVLLSATAASASAPCSPLVCDPTKPGGLALCAYKADWIVEADVIGITVETGPLCADIVGCSVNWRNSEVEFSRTTVAITKGASTLPLSNVIKVVESGALRIGSGSHCWSRTTQLDPSMIGKRIRLYGFGSENVGIYGPYAHVGFFAYELLE